jgi:D-sedoheptulose 7-phosphate isomerase
MINKIVEKLNELPQDLLNQLLDLVRDSSQVILIGNGGSNAIASHIAVDYLKFLGKKSIALTDASLITAYMNDYGVEYSYRKYLESMTDDKTLVILISSSGNSKNIYYAAEYCKYLHRNFVILTGFDKDNLVRKTFKNDAKIDYWVDSNSYGVIECVHQIFLHSIINN